MLKGFSAEHHAHLVKEAVKTAHSTKHSVGESKFLRFLLPWMSCKEEVFSDFTKVSDRFSSAVICPKHLPPKNLSVNERKINITLPSLFTKSKNNAVKYL